ncbi:MAG: transposase [Flavobacteriaceae bacterium]|nr:transposase [Flavobacteriaceae bacterium]NQY31535.1 transposase [Flavobacteriaceae bacterium]
MGINRLNAFKITGVTRHQFYYKSKSTKQGIKPSIYTKKIDEKGKIKQVINTEIIEVIKSNQTDLELNYGYHRMTKQLKIMGYLINHKKVFRLMKEYMLLKDKRKTTDKKYVKYRIVTPKNPLEVLEMDIKFVWVHEARKHAYVLSVIDTFTRVILDWTIGFSIKQNEVKSLWEDIVINHLQPNNMLEKGVSIEIRNDNDPRFSAKDIQAFFKNNYLNQVFTHPYTPQENGHIESFHAILGRAIAGENFYSIEQLNTRMTLFYEKYNNIRLHGSIASLAPNVFWEQWNIGNINLKVTEKRKNIFKLKIPYFELSGKMSLKEVSCYKENQGHRDPEMQPSVQKSPLEASCDS